jgi:hypothetical protein
VEHAHLERLVGLGELNERDEIVDLTSNQSARRQLHQTKDTAAGVVIGEYR